MTVVGDSIIVIHHMVFKGLPKTPILNLDILLCCTQKLLKGIEEVKFLHAMRGLNQRADRMANTACSLSFGQIWKNGKGVV